MRKLAERARQERTDSQQALNYVRNLVHQHDDETARRLIDQALKGVPYDANHLFD